MPLTLLNDVLFKVVFGSQRHSEALRGLLNAILELEGPKRITEITILNPIREKEHLADKGAILDVKARDAQGTLYNIEVQVQSQAGYLQRSLFYASTMVSQQLEVGNDHRLLKKSIHISLTDFVLFPKQDDIKSTYILYDVGHSRALGDWLEIHYIELAKFHKQLGDDLGKPLDCWLLFLRHAVDYHELSEIPEPLTREEGMSTAMEATHNALTDREVRYAIESRQKAERDRITELNAAEERGEARGEARGKADGKAEGKVEGEAAAMKKVARGMFEMGQSEEVILQLTGLKIEDLSVHETLGEE